MKPGLGTSLIVLAFFWMLLGVYWIFTEGNLWIGLVWIIAAVVTIIIGASINRKKK